MKRLATPEMTSSLVNSLVNLVEVTWQHKSWISKRFLALGNLIDEEPGSEEEADAKENEGEMGENSWVDWRDISRQSVQSSHGHLAICKFGNYLSQMPSPLKAGLIMSNSVHCPSKDWRIFQFKSWWLHCQTSFGSLTQRNWLQSESQVTWKENNFDFKEWYLKKVITCLGSSAFLRTF